MRNVYLNVTDLALYQRCPALFAYRIFKGKKDAWRVGIHGNGEYYGSIFHNNIARVFFQAAANSRNILHEKISASLTGQADTLEKIIRENIFMPFVEKNAQNFSSGQIIAMARAVKFWAENMTEFFSGIPSLMKNPREIMRTVFIPPEQKLKSHYDFSCGRLFITGCYDALLFNPDKAEARLFEFKGYRKSDIVVPLSQSVIYAWLIYKHTGIFPAIEIIYLDDSEKTPDIFSSQVTADLARKIPGLLRAVFYAFVSRRLPNFSRDKNLCAKCKFNQSCAEEFNKK